MLKKQLVQSVNDCDRIYLYNISEELFLNIQTHRIYLLKKSQNF